MAAQRGGRWRDWQRRAWVKARRNPRRLTLEEQIPRSEGLESSWSLISCVISWAQIVPLLSAGRFLWLARSQGKTGKCEGLLLAEEIDEELGNTSGFFVLQPVGGVCEGVEFCAVAVAETVVGHFGEKKGVAFAPEDAGGDVDSRVRKFAAMAKCGAVPVDHGGERTGLRPCCAALCEIFGGESAGAAGSDERANAEAEVEGGERGFGNKGELEEEHVPTATELATVRF